MGEAIVQRASVAVAAAVGGIFWASVPAAQAAIHQLPAAPSGPVCPPGYFVSPDDLTACLPPTPGNDFVSIAASTTNGQAGWGSGSSFEEADRIAVAQCVANSGSVCEVIVNAANGCVAYAVDADAHQFRGGAGPDRPSAAADALVGLANGQVGTVQCSHP